MINEFNLNFINAVRENNLPAAQTLLSQGAQINAIDEQGRSSLHWAVINKNLTAIQFLLSRHAEIDIEDVQEFTPFDWVFVNSEGELDYGLVHFDRRIAEVLIKAGTNLNIYYQGAPLLNDLICNGHYDLAWLAVEHGAHVNALEIIEGNEAASLQGKGTTALHHLAKIGDEQDAVMMRLIRKVLLLDADVNALDIDLRTPLHLAVLSGNIFMVRTLLQAGAALDLRDKFDCTAEDLAEEEEDNVIVQLIAAHKQRMNSINKNNVKTTATLLSNLTISTPPLVQAGVFQQPKTNKKPTRKKTSATKNVSPSVHDLPRVNHLQSPLEQIENSSENIVEHAKRRVLLYFYQLIYYYNTTYEVKLDDTTLQNGKGENDPRNKKVPYLRGCHSSLFPSPYGLVRKLNENQVLSLKVVWPENNYFYNALNSTFLLPHPVNVFDGHLEGRIREDLQSLWRSTALSIMNHVSQGRLKPVEGLNCFFNAAHQFFQDLLNKYDLTDIIKRRICEYEYSGTVDCSWTPAAGVSKEYIHLHLGLTSQEEERVNNTPELADDIYESKYKELKAQMLSGVVSESAVNNPHIPSQSFNL